MALNGLLIGQTIEEMALRIDEAKSDDEKIDLTIAYVSDAIWELDLSEEVDKRIERALDICKIIETCGDKELWLRAQIIDIQLNRGELDDVLSDVDKIMVSPLLDDPLLVAYLYELQGMHFLVSGNIVGKEQYFSKAIALLEKHDKKGRRLAINYQYEAIYNNYISRPDSALYYAHKSLDAFKIHQDTSNIISILLGLSSYYMAVNDAQHSLESLLEAKENSDQFSSEENSKTDILISLAMFYENHKEIDNALAIAEEGILGIENNSSIEADKRATALWNFYLIKGRIFIRNGEEQEGLEFIQKAILLCKDNELFPTLLITARMFEVEAYIYLENYELSEAYLARLVSELQYNQNYEIYNVKILKLAVQQYSSSKNSRPSYEYQNQLEAICYRVIEKNRDQYNKDALAAFHLLALLKTYNGASDEVISLFEKVNEIKDSIAAEEKKVTVNKLLVEYKAKEQEQQLQLQAVELGKTKMERNRLMSLILGLLLLILMLLYIWRQKRRYNTELEQRIYQRTKDLQNSNKQLQQSNEELERFAYISSHDLKEPLRNIVSYIGLMEHQNLIEKEEVKTYFGFVKQSAAHVYRLVEDVLEFSLLKNKEIQKKEVDVSQIVEETKSAISKYITQCNADIHVSKLPIIYSDKTLLSLIFKNLIENALKYNESERPKIHITHKEDEQFYYFSVKDNGIGMDLKFKDQIFEMFKRLHNKDQYDGSGIGLAICKRVADYLGGHIDVESSLGNGSTFTFSVKK